MYPGTKAEVNGIRTVDENGIATEDLQVLDLNGDGKPDIVASGRATKNLKIYWNKTEPPPAIKH